MSDVHAVVVDDDGRRHRHRHHHHIPLISRTEASIAAVIAKSGAGCKESARGTLITLIMGQKISSASSARRSSGC